MGVGEPAPRACAGKLTLSPASGGSRDLDQAVLGSSPWQCEEARAGLLGCMSALPLGCRELHQSATQATRGRQNTVCNEGPRSVFSRVGNSGVWDDCCDVVSCVPRCLWHTAGSSELDPQSVLSFRASMNQAGRGRLSPGHGGKGVARPSLVRRVLEGLRETGRTRPSQEI